MPTEIKNSITTDGDVSLLRITSDDPRRNGRVDMAVFDTKFLPIVSAFKWNIVGGLIINEYGRSLQKMLGDALGMHRRHEPNEDYTSANFTKQSLPSDYTDRSSLSAHLQKYHEKRRNLLATTFHSRIKWKRHEDWSELPVETQDKSILHVKINNKFAHLLPKYVYFIGNKLYFRTQDSSKSVHGQSILAYIYQKLAAKTKQYYALDDPFDFRFDSNNQLIRASYYTRCTYIDCEENLTVLIIESKGTKVEWSPLRFDPPFRYPAYTNLNNEHKITHVVFDTSAKDKLLDLEVDWKWNDELNAVTGSDDTFNFRMHRVLADVYGLPIGEQLVPSRMSKAYQKAIESDNYRKRAYLENLLPEQKKTANVLYTNPQYRSHKRCSVNKVLFVPDLYEGIGCYCLDMRKDSIHLGNFYDV